MTYQTKEELLDTIKDRVGETNLFIYEEYLNVLVDKGIFDLYKEADADIFRKVFFPLICKEKSKKQTREEIIAKQTDFLNNKIIPNAQLAMSITKQDVLQLMNDLCELSRGLYYTRVDQDKHPNNNNIETITYSLCSELNLKMLHMLGDSSLSIPLQKARKEILETKKRKDQLLEAIYNNLKNQLKTTNDSINNRETAEKEELLDGIRTYTGNPDERVSGHHLYAWINNVPKKDMILIKHLLITMNTRDYFKEKRLPNSDEIVDGKDYLLFLQSFNPEELLKQANEQLLNHSNDNVESRYLEVVRSLGDNFHLALATATTIVLDYRQKEINKALKKDEELYSDEELLLLNSLDEETKEFINFIKNNILDSKIINIGNLKILENIKKYVQNLHTIKDIERLNDSFQLWINSIDLSKLTNEEFDNLDRLDSKFVYNRLPLQSKVIYKRRIENKNITKEDIFGADANYDRPDVLSMINLDPDIYMQVKDFIKNRLTEQGTIIEKEFEIFPMPFHNPSMDEIAKKYEDNEILKHIRMLTPDYLTMQQRRKGYDSSINENVLYTMSNPLHINGAKTRIITREGIKRIKDNGKVLSFLGRRKKFFNDTINSESKDSYDEFKAKLATLEINGNMLPLTEKEAYMNYILLMKKEKDFDFDIVMHSIVENTDIIIKICNNNKWEFYPELILMNVYDYSYEELFEFYRRIRNYKTFHNNEIIPKELINEYFFDEEKFKSLVEREKEERDARRKREIQEMLIKMDILKKEEEKDKIIIEGIFSKK